jgi:uncharacterized protein YndB with AHSA1/START domain
MKTCLAGLLWFSMTSTATTALAQDMRNTSFTGPAGERVLRFEVVVDADVKRVWSAITTTAGLATWFSPQAVVEFRTGGAVTARDAASARIGDSGVARLDISAYRELEMITFHIDLDDTFSETIREQDDDLRAVVELMPKVGNRTTITLSLLGWGKGRIWDDAYAFFAKRMENACVRLMNTLSNR